MESETAQPLKVCRHCSVASRTDAETCPNCGQPYQRRLWRWWLAIPIVALAFAGGFAGRKLIEGDDSEGAPGITAQQGREAELGISRTELEGQLAGEPPVLVEHPEAGPVDTCLYYAIADQPNSVWEFCFTGDQLQTSDPVRAPEE